MANNQYELFFFLKRTSMNVNLHIPSSFLYSLTLPFFLSMLCVSHTARSSLFSANVGDSHALLSIKAEIVQDSYGVLASWNNSLHFCNWTGVSCNLKEQRVMGLNLASLELSGNLSASIGNLSALRDLNLENNFFSGSIPQEISHLYQMQYLLLSNNSFVGEIPRNFTYLSELNVIDLGRNKLTGSIPAEVGSLSNLVELHISQNNLSGTLPSSLGNLTALKVLSLSFNNLEGIIPEELGKLTNLQFLQLSSNKLTGTLPILLHNITSLQHIMLSFNKLSGSLPVGVGFFHTNLQTFAVGENQFMGSIPSSVTNASGLEILDIGVNSLSGPIPFDLGNLKNLQRLDLSGNSFASNESNGLNFFTSLTNCTSLTFLHLNENNISGVLPGSVANLSTILISLRLDGNHISGVIPPGLENLKNLGRLALRQNTLMGTVPELIGKLTKLQILYLSNNRFVGRIPSSIGNLTLLSSLEMQENLLEGSIPVSLGNCSLLLSLDLSSNRLTNGIPTQIFELSSLAYDLSLENNFLSGRLPFEVGNLVNLVNFDISHNNLSGEIPSTIGRCVTLELFSIQGNHFRGSILPSLTPLLGIRFLDLSSNDLFGQIPKAFTTFRYVQFLNLSFNSLDGEVPSEGLFMNTTAFSIEGNQKLCGGIKSLHLAECHKEASHRKHIIISKKLMLLVLPSVVIFVVMLVVYTCILYNWARRALNQSVKLPLESPLGDQYPKLSYTELLQATDGFSPSQLIALGRFSSVYRGILKNSEQMIAVKVINLQQSGARKSFLSECEALRNIRHRNVVKIFTSCSGIDFSGNEFKALVYEYMTNGNLESWLHPLPTNLLQPKNLDLIQRLNIAIDVASALVHLHHGSELPVIHRDIKPSNILLDDELCAHVGDFGSARSLLLPIDKTTHLRIRSSAIGIVGTVGYVALELGMGGRVSTLVDVYSFGILLLEVFTGKRPTDSMFKDDFSLRTFVKTAIPNQVMRIADPRLLAGSENEPFKIAGDARGYDTHEIEKFLASVFQIGLVCSARLAKERIEISDALMQLRAVRDALFKIQCDRKLVTKDNAEYAC